MDYLPSDQNPMPEFSEENVLVNEFGQLNHESTYPNFFPPNLNSLNDDPSSSSSLSSEVFSATLKYISDMLMAEEDLENKPSMLVDCLALQAAEKSLHDVLNQQNPCSSDAPLAYYGRQNNGDDSDDFINHNTISSTAATNWDDSGIISFQNVLQSPPADFSTHLVPNSLFSDGNGETPAKHGNYPTSGSRSKKHRHWENGDYPDEGRSNKQSAVYTDESVSQEMLDKVVLYHQNTKSESCSSLQESYQLKRGSRLRGSKGKKTGKNKEHDRGMVDFQSLLTQCAKAVSRYDRRTATELLDQIRQHSSPYGNGSQRLAHYFAKGLEERLTANIPSYDPLCLSNTNISSAGILKAYQTYITASPFWLMLYIYANESIIKLAEKATRLHIIDFGILHGYQWPSLIQILAKRPAGPPKLRITGIELPQSGFRPSGRIEETGHRLASYCKRFNVPFEYNFIAEDWETIQYEDIKLDSNEMTVVNCLHRLKNLPDDTEIKSPKDTVLKLIRRINPDIFIQAVANGTYNSFFFDIRFREALYHYSSMFDMFEETLPREDQQRLLLEQEVFGREVINVIACEGSKRLERPETYKQWYMRNIRAGFKQLPSDKDILTIINNMVKSDYHKDFVVGEDRKWILQGWRGRIIHAISCWKPAS